jgi:hypothetical protein
MVSALPGIGREVEPGLRCRQVVAAESSGQCFRLNVLYGWGATMSMVSWEAIDMMGLSPSKQPRGSSRAWGVQRPCQGALAQYPSWPATGTSGP